MLIVEETGSYFQKTFSVILLHTSDFTTSATEMGTEECDSRVQRGDEAKAHSFSGPVVLVFEAS